MRCSLHLALAAALLSGGLTLPTRAQAAGADPEELYKGGQADYAEGRFKSAIAKMSEAYEGSSDPLMLYYIGQAYRDWYNESAEPKHLQEAKVIFEKFIVALQADPTLGDPADIRPKIEEIDELLAAAEAAAAAAVAAEAEPEALPEDQPAVRDPGRPLKITGGALLGIGGAAFLGGAGLGIAFGIRGINLSDEISGLRDQFAGDGCDAAMPMPGPCADLDATINATIDDGRRANIMTGVGWGIAGFGAALAITGGVLMSRGIRKSDVWRAEHAHLRLTPTFGGLLLSGRF